MKNTMMFAAAGAVVGLFALAGSASALTVERPGIAEANYSKVALVCSRDDRGWHQMRGDRRVVCRPARPGREWGWHTEGGRSGWWHRREHRWND